MDLTSEIKRDIHFYVILELAIKSVQHDKKLFESFRFRRPYLALCEQQIEVLNEEFKALSRTLYKQGIKYEKYKSTGENECMYYFLCQGESVPFHYQGNMLKKQVEKKINLMWCELKCDETAWNNVKKRYAI